MTLETPGTGESRVVFTCCPWPPQIHSPPLLEPRHIPERWALVHTLRLSAFAAVVGAACIWGLLWVYRY